MNNLLTFPKGSLAVVALPLGNAADISERALFILGEADLVAAEDTRDAQRFLSAHNISAKLVSYHDWNESARASWLADMLENGTRIALISDAGTPAISDPGFDLVREARRRGHNVFPVPGPCALTSFLSVCGLPTNAFTFLGFVPNKTGKRKAFYHSLARRPETLVFYESPHRFKSSLVDALEAFGDREVAFGREMTKKHEEFYFGPLSVLVERLSERERVKGEVVWGITGYNPGEVVHSEEELVSAIESALKGGLSPKAASKELAESFDKPAKEIYSLMMKLADSK
jgi:16S rRNA (cytidine1402-2'-O)-methyltransferase